MITLPYSLVIEATDFESWETVSIAESAQCPLVRRPPQLVNHESTRMDTNHKSICVRPGSSRRSDLTTAASRRALVPVNRSDETKASQAS